MLPFTWVQPVSVIPLGVTCLPSSAEPLNPLITMISAKLLGWAPWFKLGIIAVILAVDNTGCSPALAVSITTLPLKDILPSAVIGAWLSIWTFVLVLDLMLSTNISPTVETLPSGVIITLPVPSSRSSVQANCISPFALTLWNTARLSPLSPVRYVFYC